MFEALDAPPVEAVVVAAARLPTSVAEAAYGPVAVPPEQMRARPRVDEALASVPGVALFRRNASVAANPTTQGLSLRQIGPTGAGRALVTLDGAPINDPFGGWVIWSQLQPETLGPAAILRGAGAGPYGAGALTGTVRLETADRLPDALRGEIVSGGQGYRRGALTGQAGWTGGRLVLSGAAEHLDGYVPVRRERRGLADQKINEESLSAAALVNQTLGDVGLSARLSGWREKRGAGLVGAGSVAQGASLSVAAARQPTDEHLGWRLQGWAVRSDLRNRSVATGAGRALTTPANDQFATPATGYGLNAALRGAWWEVGADARAFDGETRERYSFQNGAFTRHRTAGGRTGVAGVYGEVWRDAGPWLLTAGGRIDRWRTWDGRRIERLLATGGAVLDDRPADRDGIAPTARAAVRYAVSDALYLRASAYGGFRPATLNELYRPFRVGNDITEANGGLKPETLKGAELAVGGDKLVRWSVTVFSSKLENAVANVTIGAGPGTFPIAGFVPAGGVLRQRQNVGHIDARGIEAQIDGDIAPALSARLAGSTVDARVDGAQAAPQLTGLRPAQAPIWSATGGLRWTPSPALSADLALRYEGARWDDDLNTRRLSPGFMVDARMDVALNGQAAMFIAADNLLDRKVETAQTADRVESLAQPRLLRIGLVLRR